MSIATRNIIFMDIKRMPQEKMYGNCFAQFDMDKKKFDMDEPIAILKTIYRSWT